MRAVAFAWVAAVLVAGAVAATTAVAKDQIKPGKWEFSVLLPGVTKLPPGLQNQAGVQTRAGPSGTTISRTECTTAANPLPPMVHGPGADHPCKTEKLDVSGATVRWAWGCATEKWTAHSEGVLRYHGDTADGEYTFRTSVPGHPPVARTQSVTGRYLGPCGSK